MKIGITERGDAGLDFSWVDKLYDANVIITKKLNDKMIDNLLCNKSRIILHLTCTGYGRTVLEPNVPSMDYSYEQVLRLIEKGFPAKQIVLRTDPIIPTDRGIKAEEKVLEMFRNTGIKRVRFSFMDLYPHVKERFIETKVPLPYVGFTAPLNMRLNAVKMLQKWEDVYEIESCAEDTKYKLGCISQKDIDILGIKEALEPGGFQRKGCLCASGKTELLENRFRCPHKCLYCYWKDEK